MIIKRYILLILSILAFVINAMAQDCYSDNRAKGVSAYNSGKYAEAKKYFQSAQNCDMKPKQNDIARWIDNCNKKINEKKQAQTPKQATQVAPKLYLETSVGSVNDDGRGSIVTITVKTNASHWNYEYVPSWCSIRNKTATSFELQIYSNPNTTSRSDWFNIKTSDGSVVKRITVTQAGKLYNLSVSPSVVNDIEGNGKSQTIYVMTNDPNWKIEYLPDWCYVTGRTSSSFVLNIKPNPISAARNDYIRIKTKDGFNEQKISVYQGVVYYLSVSPAVVTDNEGSGKWQKISVTTNVPYWKIENLPDWCYITSKTSSSFVLNIEPNPNTISRNGGFNVKTSDGSVVQKITISQLGKKVPKSISLSPTYFYEYTGNGTTITINVETNANWWEITSQPQWCTISDKTSKYFVIHIEPNKTSSSRYGTVYVKTSDGIMEQINISQFASTTKSSKMSSNSYNLPFLFSLGCFFSSNDDFGASFRLGYKVGYLGFKSNFRNNESNYEATANSYYYEKNSEKISRWSALGGMRFLWKRDISFYIGLGYGVRNYYAKAASQYSWQDGELYKITDNSVTGLELEGGVNLYGTKHLGITAGYSVLAFKYSEFTGGVIFRW